RRRATARGRGPRLRQPPAHLVGRRAHGKPGPHHQSGHHATARTNQQDGHHRRHRHPRLGHRRPDASTRYRARSRNPRPGPGPRRLRLWHLSPPGASDMPVSFDYLARETASNLWRNRLMTIAAILTVAVSLSLVGTSLLLRQGVAHATTQWQHGVNVELFLKPSVSDAQRHSITQQVTQLPYVQSCFYRSKLYDYNEAKHLLSPDEAQSLSVGTTPSSLRCVLNNPSEAQAIGKQFNGYPGVRNVASPIQAIKTMESVTRVLQVVFLALALILLLSASVLILNTIRLAIFA